jgi:hypothetical protein
MTGARTFAGTLLLGAMLAGCASAPSGAAAANRGAATSGPALEAKMVALPFRLDVTFTPAALARLSALEARVKVSADYYGPPKAAGSARVDPDLGVWLGGETFAIEPGARSLTFKGRIDAAQVRKLGGQCLQVLLCANATAMQDGVHFEMLHPSEDFMQSITAYGLDLSHFSSQEQAI